jgi:hypothetical protein
MSDLRGACAAERLRVGALRSEETLRCEAPKDYSPAKAVHCSYDITTEE